MSGYADLAAKIAMAAAFAAWIWRHRSDGTSEKASGVPDKSFARKLLVCAFLLYAALSAYYVYIDKDFVVGRFALYLAALLLTLVLECAAALLMGYRGKNELPYVALCSVVTHPALHLTAGLPWALFRQDLFLDHWVYGLEALVVVTECRLLNGLMPWKRGSNAKLAFVMNGFSFLAGLAITEAVLWWLWTR